MGSGVLARARDSAHRVAPACARSDFRAGLYPLAAVRPGWRLFFLMRRRRWPISYEVASARAGSRQRAWGAPVVCSLCFSCRTLSIGGGPAGLAVVLFDAPTAVADQLWGRVGSSGLATARIGGHRRVLALSFGPVFIHWRRSGRAGGCSF